MPILMVQRSNKLFRDGNHDDVQQSKTRRHRIVNPFDAFRGRDESPT